MELTAPAEANPVVLRDVFPAEVALPGGIVYRTARAVITRERVYVWLAEGQGRRLVYSEPYEPAASRVAPINAPRSQRTHLVLAGEEEQTVHVSRQRGCGCGNPLKGWTPWQPFAKGAA